MAMSARAGSPEESVEQFVISLRAFSRLRPHGIAIDEPGLSILFGDFSWPLLNAAIFTAPADVDAAAARLGRARAFFGARPRAWVLAVREDWLGDGVGELVARSGFKPTMTLTGMATGAIEPPVRAAPPELRIRRVAGAEERAALADINSSAYGTPLPWGREISDAAVALWDDPHRAHLGLVDGQPVAVSATSLQGEALYVGWVATLPGHRARGYAEAVMRASLAEAMQALGRSHSVLHATDAGLPVYRRMGYRTVARFSLFVPA